MNEESITKARKILRELLIFGIILIIFLLIYKHDTQVYRDNLAACEKRLAELNTFLPQNLNITITPISLYSLKEKEPTS